MSEERDPRLSQRYRELGAEEPPRHLDDAILAASRRRWRWTAPIAAAAVIVLAVAVAIHFERERPDAEMATAMQAPSAPPPRTEPQKEEKVAADAMLAKRRDAARAPEAAAARALVEPPEKWLERIAEMRKQGRHQEADKALEEFRKRYRDYEVPEALIRGEGK